jgi:hypothetical protein
MTACFYQIRMDNILSKKDDNFRFIECIKLIYYIEKNKINEVIKYIMTYYCGIHILGYYKYCDKYWCKKKSKASCDLHIEIEVIKKGFNYSHIKIIPLVGNDKIINNFVKKFHEGLQLYQCL